MDSLLTLETKHHIIFFLHAFNTKPSTHEASHVAWNKSMCLCHGPTVWPAVETAGNMVLDYSAWIITVWGSSYQFLERHFKTLKVNSLMAASLKIPGRQRSISSCIGNQLVAISDPAFPIHSPKLLLCLPPKEDGIRNQVLSKLPSAPITLWSHAKYDPIATEIAIKHEKFKREKRFGNKQVMTFIWDDPNSRLLCMHTQVIN